MVFYYAFLNDTDRSVTILLKHLSYLKKNSIKNRANNKNLTNIELFLKSQTHNSER